MNEMVIFDAKTPASINFKDEALQRVSLAIAENMAEVGRIYNDAKERTEAVNRALAPLFAEVVNGKLYEKGGYKSLDAYSEEVFGIKKSMAYMLARVGNAFFLTDNEYTRKARDTFSVSTLGELCNSDRVAIASAIDAGELTADTEQKTVREWGASHRKDGKSAKEKVVPTFDLFVVHPTAPDGKRKIAEDITKEELSGKAWEHTGMIGVQRYITTVKMDGDKASAAQHFVAVSESGIAFLFEYRPHVTAEKAKKAKKEGFDLQAYLASLTPAQLASLQEQVAAKVAGPDDGSEDAYTAEDVHKEAGLF